MVILYKTIAGSRLYGLADENSDEDYEGVYFPTLSQLLGLRAVQKAKTEKGIFEDCTMYSLQGYMKLVGDSNFKVLETLFAPDDKVITINPVFNQLRDQRDKFLNIYLIRPLIGFCKSNLNNIHKLPTSSKRCKLFNACGFDSKYLQHSYRILRVGEEYLKTGKFKVDFSDEREYLLDIKYGRIPLDIIMARIELMQSTLLSQLEEKESLTNREAIKIFLDDLCVKMSLELVQECWQLQTNFK
jgi:hypothetical protein